MSCMNLGKRLQPAKKAWKSFTTKIHSKFRSLNGSKSIKKPEKSFKIKHKYSSSTVTQSRVSCKRKKIHKSKVIRSYKLQKRSLVYIDDLFNEPVVRTKVYTQEKSSTSSDIAELVDPKALAIAGKREKVEGGEGGTSRADDMWESLQLASPLMHGIDERAEEFIARIKGEMQFQETIARRL